MFWSVAVFLRSGIFRVIVLFRCIGTEFLSLDRWDGRNTSRDIVLNALGDVGRAVDVRGILSDVVESTRLCDKVLDEGQILLGAC